MFLETIGNSRPFVRCASLALVGAALAACGGGGGGGGGSNNNPTNPNTQTGLNDPRFVECRNAQNRTSSGLTLRVCNVSVNGGEQNDTAFADVASSVAINNYTAKSYTLNLPAPVGAATAFTVNADPAASNEDRCQNVLGGVIGLTLQIPQVPGPNDPRTALISFTQPTGGADPRPNRCPGGQVIPAALTLQAIDFGTWERFVGGSELYYSGWYTQRAGSPVRPATAFAFDGAGRGTAGNGGLATGYLFTAISSFGVSSALTGVSFNPATNQLTGTINTFTYSRNGQRTQPDAAIEQASFTANVRPDGTFSGNLTGTGAVTPAGGARTPAAVNGVLEGVIVNTGTAAGLEIGGRFQANLAVAGSTGSARVVGSFATAE